MNIKADIQKDFHQSVLDNMRDGVMALNFQGSITLFNPAAATILGMDARVVREHTFAEVFLAAEEENDAFNQMVLDAVTRKKVGQRETVAFIRPDGQKMTLSLSSSWLHREEEKEAMGVVVVFSDITELTVLQEQERNNSRKLAKAYEEIEASNLRLTGLLKRVQMVRGLATAGIILFFVGLGYFHFQGFSNLSSPAKEIKSARMMAEGTQGIHTVTTSPVTSSISLSGRLQPLEEIMITAPFDAKILERHFSFGQVVDKGDILLLLDTTETKMKLREARSSYIKALQNYEELASWNESTEMARARRSLQRAESSLENHIRQLEEATLLFDRGIIPAQELDRAKQQVETSRMDLISSREEMTSTHKKASPENLSIVTMELDNASLRLSELESLLAQAEVRAPVSGVVIQPVTEESKKQSLDQGARVQAGTALFALGDLSGLKVFSRVDEVEIGRLSLNQTVRARGDAFPGIILDGYLSHISAQATSEGSREAPGFEVQVTLPELSAKAVTSIRIGMSADLEILIYDNPKALLVPLYLVRSMGNHAMVRIIRDDGSMEERKVTTGITTPVSVEILSGLESGERLGGWTP
ncbi:PAS domain S-box protein [Desulfobotulus sp. H1]|uniref:PAS domain S-box protein n=1 Tax=Desulfobotulus pelophilus TaxID=2823377 RepID=A0ABT3NA06_9BACT|nr:PAS domain S-box protein [Desulfobotulus pelophilus]MCW7754296.1 PAS domain S-box protein [Desulfobotulus pelophilus]